MSQPLFSRGDAARGKKVWYVDTTSDNSYSHLLVAVFDNDNKSDKICVTFQSDFFFLNYVIFCCINLAQLESSQYFFSAIPTKLKKKMNLGMSDSAIL